MRQIVETMTCDRCGSVLTKLTADDDPPLFYIDGKLTGGHGEHVDLCPRCENDLDFWFRMK